MSVKKDLGPLRFSGGSFEYYCSYIISLVTLIAAIPGDAVAGNKETTACRLIVWLNEAAGLRGRLSKPIEATSPTKPKS